MNKWYKLGQEFNKKYSSQELYELLRDNNHTNALGCIGKDFKEKDYIRLCKIIGATPVEENRHYLHGERKYYFLHGFDQKLSII